MTEKAIIDKEVVTFFSTKKDYRSLSNFWEKEVIISDKKDKREYDTGEHCFHGEKYIRIGRLTEDKARKQELVFYGLSFVKPSKYKTCNDAKKKGGKSGLMLTKEEIELWYYISIQVQIDICMYKYETYPEVKTDILNSKDKILVHPALRTSEENVKSKIWEGKAIIKDGAIHILGKNRLGNIWMEVRDYYK